jgi:hypothetical protein
MSTLQVYSYYISPFAHSRESNKPDFITALPCGRCPWYIQLLREIIRHFITINYAMQY